jgi:hypothetical protein
MTGTDHAPRWAQLRFVILRSGSSEYVWALLERNHYGKGYQDRLLARGAVPMPPGDPASREATTALITAVDACLRRLGDRRAPAAKPLRRPLRGPQGWVDQPLPGLDSAARIRTSAAAVERSGDEVASEDQ